MVTERTRTIKKTRLFLLVVGKDSCLEVNAEKNKCIFTSRKENAQKMHNIKLENMSFLSATKFKYLGTTLGFLNYVPEEVKCILNSGYAYYHSVQRILSSTNHPKKNKD